MTKRKTIIKKNGWRPLGTAPLDTWVLVSEGTATDPNDQTRNSIVIAKLSTGPGSGNDEFKCSPMFTGGHYCGAKWWRPLPHLPQRERDCP